MAGDRPQPAPKRNRKTDIEEAGTDEPQIDENQTDESHTDEPQTDEPQTEETGQEEGLQTETVYTTTEQAGEGAAVQFSTNQEAGHTVTLADSRYPLSWGLSDGTGAAARIKETGRSTGQDPLAAEVNSQTLVYPEVCPGVDAEYRIGPAGVKENLILKVPEAGNTYTILYQTRGTGSRAGRCLHHPAERRG